MARIMPAGISATAGIVARIVPRAGSWMEAAAAMTTAVASAAETTATVTAAETATTMAAAEATTVASAMTAAGLHINGKARQAAVIGVGADRKERKGTDTEESKQRIFLHGTSKLSSGTIILKRCVVQCFFTAA
jgi:hypothetical protein